MPQSSASILGSLGTWVAQVRSAWKGREEQRPSALPPHSPFLLSMQQAPTHVGVVGEARDSDSLWVPEQGGGGSQLSGERMETLEDF